MKSKLRFLVKNKQSFIALFVLIIMVYNACSDPTNPPEGTPEKNNAGAFTPKGFFVDSDGNITKTDSGRTVLVADDKAEVVFYSDDIESGDDDRVGLTFEEKTIIFLFENGQNFPGKIVLSSPKESYNGTFTAYDPETQTYGLTLEQGGVKETLSDIVLGKDIFTQYNDDEDLTPSQNQRMRNLYIAMRVYTSLDDFFYSDNTLQSQRGIWGFINTVAQVFFPGPVTSIVVGTIAVGFGAANFMSENPVTMLSGLSTLNEGTKLIIDGINQVFSGSSSFIAVTGITGVPTTASVGTLTLSGTIAPANATNKTIVWTVKSSGTTGAKISGNTLTTTAAGTVTVTASIANGKTAGTPYTQDFPIAITVTISDVNYTVTFDANGGNGTAPVPQIVKIGSSITLPGGSGLSKNKAVFDGWSANSSGAGTKYSAGSSFTPTGNITLYAVWKNSGYTVYYYKGYPFDESSWYDSETVEPGSTVKLPALSSTELRFWGWSTKSGYDSNGTSYYGSITPTGDVSLFGIWQLNIINLTVVNRTSTSVTLSWDKAPYATGYDVSYYVSNSTTSTKVDYLSSTTATYTITGLKPNTSYQFLVIACHITGTGSSAREKIRLSDGDGFYVNVTTLP